MLYKYLVNKWISFQKKLMQTLKGGMVRARTSLAAVGPGTFATVQEPFLVWLAPHQAPHSPTWGIQQRDWESPGNLTLKVRGLDYRASTGLGKTETPGGHQHTLCTQHPEQRSSGPTRDWADLPVRVWGSPADVWAHLGVGALTTAVLGGAVCWHQSSWRRSPLALP